MCVGCVHIHVCACVCVCVHVLTLQCPHPHHPVLTERAATERDRKVCACHNDKITTVLSATHKSFAAESAQLDTL